MQIPLKSETLFSSEPMQIGKHEWRVVAYKHSNYGPVTQYQWRKYSDESWRPHEDWPKYDTNDGVYGGLPKSLRKLYGANKPHLLACGIAAG